VFKAAVCLFILWHEETKIIGTVVQRTVAMLIAIKQTSVLASFKKKMRFDTVPWQVMINYGTKVFAACIHPVPELLRGTLTRSSQQIHRRYRCPETIRRLCSTECVSLSVSIQQSNILIVNEMMPEYQAELILLLTTF
jgi:hypothetical protein